MKNTFAKRARDIHSPQDLYEEIGGVVWRFNMLLAQANSPTRIGTTIKDDVVKIISTNPEPRELLSLSRTDSHFPDMDDGIGGHYYAHIPATKTSIYISATGALKYAEIALADALDADSKSALARMDIPPGNAGLESLMQKIKADPVIALMNALPPLLADFNRHLSAGNAGCQFATFSDKDGVMVYAMPDDASDPKTVACIVPTHDVEGTPTYSVQCNGKPDDRQILLLDGMVESLRDAMFDSLSPRGRLAIINSLPSPDGP